MDDWCDQQDLVPDENRIYRCSKCGKRLHPRKIFGSDGELAEWRLPPHKKKGHKIRAIVLGTEMGPSLLLTLARLGNVPGNTK